MGNRLEGIILWRDFLLPPGAEGKQKTSFERCGQAFKKLDEVENEKGVLQETGRIF